MPKNNDDLDYSGYHYKNFRAMDNREDNKYYVSVRSGANDSIKLRALEPDEIDSMPYAPVHTVEYLTHAEQQISPKKHKYKKNPWRHRGLILVVLTILLCFAATVLIADSMSDGYILDEVNAFFTGNKLTADKYYAIEMVNFTDMNSAKVYSQELRLMGGAGYVVHDELYRVMAEVFKDKSDADKVVTRLNTSGYMARVYEIVFKEIDYSVLPSSVRNISKKVMKYVSDVNVKLYDVGVALAGNKIDKNKAISDLKTLRASASATLLDYESNCDNKAEDEYVKKIRLQLGMVLAGLENLCNSKDAVVGLLSDIRYTNIMMINTHRALCNDIQITEGKK